jgi:hypothetical protein
MTLEVLKLGFFRHFGHCTDQEDKAMQMASSFHWVQRKQDRSRGRRAEHELLD